MAEQNNGSHSDNNSDEFNNKDNNNQDQNNDQGNKDQDDTPKTYTQQEVDDMIKSERDERIKFQRIADQRQKKLEEGSKGKNDNSTNKELDYAQKAFLVANGIKGSEEFEIVQEAIRNTGKSLEEVIDSRYVKLELQTLREQKATEEATPRGSNRSGASSRTNVDYWIAKGELPPDTPENQDLRRKVVNEKQKRYTNKTKFGG